MKLLSFLSFILIASYLSCQISAESEVAPGPNINSQCQGYPVVNCFAPPTYYCHQQSDCTPPSRCCRRIPALIGGARAIQWRTVFVLQSTTVVNNRTAFGLTPINGRLDVVIGYVTSSVPR
ncbi:unnamed protein product [Allacma fusca]|uniref:WAP domain-containing protein n=1 Tax=Allacma fusca TaxID=39272 RepID=A0A8J2KIQ4_9HEXA|nr:unnamed protein product [Allacma fusca]